MGLLRGQAGAPAPAETSARDLEALVSIFESLSLHENLQDLLRDIAVRLRPVVSFDLLYISLYDALHNVMRVSVVEATVPVEFDGHLEVPLARSPAGVAWQTQQMLVLSDIANEPRFPEVGRLMYESNIWQICVFPLTSVHRRLGGIAFGRVQNVAFTQQELQLLEKATVEIALAVDNTLRHLEVASYEQQLKSERDRARLLLEFTNTLVSNLDLQELFGRMSVGLRKILHHDYASLVLPDPASDRLIFHAIDFPGGKGLVHPNLAFGRAGSLAERAFATGKPVCISQLQAKDFPAEPTRLLLAEGLKSVCCLPLVNRGRCVGALTLASARESGCCGQGGAQDKDLLEQIANQVAIAVDNALAFRQIAALKDKLAQENLYLESEIRTQFNFHEIIGENRQLKEVLKQVETVGPTDAPVLILGETGTGKESIARAIHRLSRHSEGAFIKINCAAIPAGLLESELFGHERGAFTGAVAAKVGRLELADKGTIFLDEIGDMPLEIQPKLLRVLQEHEFERLGSNRTIRVNVRIIAATNRNLARMVAENEFRSDLYYRLRVFPLALPPLRERKDDIPLLVRFFTQKHARRLGKCIQTIPAGSMAALVHWHWPGNIREMENFIERAIILSAGTVLNVPVEELKDPVDVPANGTLASAERDHILRVLKEAGGVVGGPHGAAARLGLKRTTLQAKMARLGIARGDGEIA